MIALLAALALGQGAVTEADRARLNAILSPSVVQVLNQEAGWGSGMLLDDKGLILTNAHVILSPTPLGVEVQNRHFQRVTLVGVHPTQDLALLRIDPSEHRVPLVPIRISKTRALNGETLIAMGYPIVNGGSKAVSVLRMVAHDRFGDMAGYQEFSGAVYPGNSGGPLCNVRGEAIGVVTLGLHGASPRGMAVPIYDLKTADFVPMSRRASNPANAHQLLMLGEQAIKFAKEGDTLAAQIAKEAFSLALLEDFSNSDIYYKIGMLARNLGQHQTAAAYLVRSLRLKPWPGSGVGCYHELGIALAKLGKAAEAVAVWREGASKYPTEGGRIWDDLAIFHMNRGNFSEAALASRAAVKAFGDRGDVMNEAYKAARSRLSAEDKIKLQLREEGLDGELQRMKAAADQARRAATPYLTPECERLIRDYGGAQRELIPSTVEVAGGPGKGKPVVRVIDPWELQKVGVWYRFRTTAGGKDRFEDLGLTRKDEGANVFSSQRFANGVPSPVQEIVAKHASFRVLGEETLQIEDRSFACEIRTPIGEGGAVDPTDREWVAVEGRYGEAVLKSSSPRRTMVAKKVWDYVLKIKGKEFPCAVVEAESKAEGRTVAIKTWYTSAIPSALRVEIDDLSVNLVDFGSDWSDRPAFPGAGKK